LGRRFFVDALMEIGDLTEADRRSIEAQVAAAGQAKSVETVLTEASVLLSGLTRSAGVVLTAKTNVRLKHIEFVRLEPERALVVLVAEDGQVENRVVVLPPGLPSSTLTEATNFLNARLRGRTLAEAKTELEKALEAGRAELDQHRAVPRRRRPDRRRDRGDRPDPAQLRAHHPDGRLHRPGGEPSAVRLDAGPLDFFPPSPDIRADLTRIAQGRT